MSHWWDSATVLVAMFCAASAHYTLHEEQVSFDDALSRCLTDGFLTGMASEEEKERVLSSVSASLKSAAGSLSFWVGLRKPAGTCQRKDLPLRGFAWTWNNGSDSGVSRWRKTPVETCTSERCALLSLDFDGGKVTDWGWADSGCARQYGFICKREPGGTTTPDVPGDGSPCPVGRTPCGGPQLPRGPPRAVLTSPPPSASRGPEDERLPTPSSAPSLTSSGSVIGHIRESTVDKYSIFIPVLVALLVLVVLVAVVLAVFKCCFRKRPKKGAAHSLNGGKPEVTVDLSATDLDQAETTA